MSWKITTPQELKQVKQTFPVVVLLVVDRLLRNSAYEFQEHGQVQITKKHIKADLAKLGVKNPPEWYFEFEEHFELQGWTVLLDESEPKAPVYIFTTKK